MHKLANRAMLTALRDGGLLTGDVDEMMEVSVKFTVPMVIQCEVMK